MLPKVYIAYFILHSGIDRLLLRPNGIGVNGCYTAICRFAGQVVFDPLLLIIAQYRTRYGYPLKKRLKYLNSVPVLN